MRRSYQSDSLGSLSPASFVKRVILSILLVFGSTASAQIIERFAGQEPQLGQENHVVQGETMFSDYDYPVQHVAVPQDNIVLKKWTIPAGTSITAKPKGRTRLRFCVSGKPKDDEETCFIDTDEDGNFDKRARFLTSRRGMTQPGLISSSKLEPNVTYRQEKKPVPARDLPGSAGSFRRREIVYQGAAGGVLRLLYREYINDLAREAYSQELTYDMKLDESFVVAVKSVKIEILSAGNEGIRYKVLNGFDK